MSEHSVHLTSLPIGFWMWLCRYVYMFLVVNFDSLIRASNVQIKTRQIVFLCWVQDFKLGILWHHLPADWMPTHKPTIEKQVSNLNSIILMISEHSVHCRYGFIPGSGIIYFIDLEPSVPGTKAPADWQLANKPSVVSIFKLQIWTQ